MIRWTRVKTGQRTLFELPPYLTNPTSPSIDVPLETAKFYRDTFADIQKCSNYSTADSFECSGEANFGGADQREHYLLPGMYQPFTELLKDPAPLSLPDSPNSSLKLPRWLHSMKIDKTAASGKESSTPGFVLPLIHPIAFFNFSFKAKCYDPNEDTAIMGWGGGPIYDNSTPPKEIGAKGDGPGTLIIDNCLLDAGEQCDWGAVYTWFAGNKNIKITNSKILFCRFGVSVVSSGSNGVQTTELRNNQCIGNANGSKSLGDTSNQNPDNGAALSLVLQKGGVATLTQNNVRVTGLAAEYDSSGKFSCHRIATLVTDSYYGAPAPNAQYNLAGNVASISSLGVTQQLYDVDIRSKTAKVSYNMGIGVGDNGGYKLRINN